MSGVDRDIQCGNSFAKLYELGCFDEEFIVYGCGYYENGEIMYLISDDGDKLYRFRDKALQQHIYTTPIIMRLVTCPVSSGERENIRQNIKFDLAKEIKRMYCKAYYESIAALDKKQNNQSAEVFLRKEQYSLEGYFDRLGVEKFEGLCKMAYEQKKISESAYQSFKTWIVYAKKQMENDVVVKDDLRRMFHGIGYERNGTVVYFADAQSMNVYKKREELLSEGAIVTPIISNEYWFKSINQLPNVRKKFMEQLKKSIDNGYLEKTKKILSYESPFNEHTIDEVATETLTLEEKEAIKLYQRIMGINM